MRLQGVERRNHRQAFPHMRRLGIELLEDRRLLSVAGQEQTIEWFNTSPALFVENEGQSAAVPQTIADETPTGPSLRSDTSHSSLASSVAVAITVSSKLASLWTARPPTSSGESSFCRGYRHAMSSPHSVDRQVCRWGLPSVRSIHFTKVRPEAASDKSNPDFERLT